MVIPAMGFRLGAAAPHQDHPNGGIRISGCIAPYNGVDGIYDAGSTAAVTGLWYAAAAANIPPLALVSPTAYGISTVTFAYPLFGTSGGPIGAIADWFRNFRFRKLVMIYTGSSATNVNGSVLVSYEQDPNAAYANATTTMTQGAAGGAQINRFPKWEPVRSCVMIPPSKANHDDKLFRCTTGGDGLTLATTSAATVNDWFQGGIFAVNSGFVTTGSTQIGSWLIDFELDLYGFSGTRSGTYALLEQRRRDAQRDELKDLVREVTDEKRQKVAEAAMSRLRLADSSDEKSPHHAKSKVLDDFVDLTPVNSRRASKK